MVPSGFLRSIWIHTSAYHARVAGRRSRALVRRSSSAGLAGAIDSWGEVSEGGRSPPPSLVANPRVQIRIREVDEEVQADDHRRDDQVHRLHHGIIDLSERLEEEEPDAGQAEDRLDEDTAAHVHLSLMPVKPHTHVQHYLIPVAANCPP